MRAYRLVRRPVVVVDPVRGVTLALVLDLVELGKLIALPVIESTLGFDRADDEQVMQLDLDVFERLRSDGFIGTPGAAL